MIHLPINKIADQTPKLLTDTDLIVDYIRAQGLVYDRLHERFGDKMKNFLAAQFQPLDLIARIGLATDKGNRLRNEDSAVAVLGHLGDDNSPVSVILCGVADGIGGSDDGDLASAIAIQTLTEHVIDKLANSRGRKAASKLNPAAIEGILTEAIKTAHDTIWAETNGGGSTLTCALIIDNLAYIAHVGDSRAYLLSPAENNIELTTTDHRLVRKFQDAGIISNQDVGHHPLRYILYRSVGKANQCEADLIRRNLASGSRLLLCTDGIWDVLTKNEIHQIVHHADDPQVACEKLVEAAITHKTHDDLTAVLVELET